MDRTRLEGIKHTHNADSRLRAGDLYWMDGTWQKEGDSTVGDPSGSRQGLNQYPHGGDAALLTDCLAKRTNLFQAGGLGRK